MAETTGISWTDATWNPWIGCTKVSPGCDHCYAERDMSRFGRHFDQVQRTSSLVFTLPLRLKEPRRIFTCSWSDFFHRGADAWREEAWEIIKATPWHTYQILTKRPGLMVAWAEKHGWPEHVWAGTSVESQKYAPRLDVLARVPAKVRFVSVEPMLEAVDLRPWLGCPHKGDEDGDICCPECGYPREKSRWIHWVIVGGESGAGFRPMEIPWLESLAQQCSVARVPRGVKQASNLRPGQQGRIPDELWARKEMP